uniref:Riboflavin kinase n=1 Tax=Ciona intestinalis TaxID=7719 RepID=H2Y3J4_CIOIN
MKLDKIMKCLPHFCRGVVVKGFGRGSKQLGIPTANFPDSVVENLPCDLPTGIYYGWAQVNSGEVHKMVLSVGWNPYYKNEKKSMETHIIHSFNEDFYDSVLSIIMLGYIRGEENFSSLDDLISAINNDIAKAKFELDGEERIKYKHHSFFSDHETSHGKVSAIQPLKAHLNNDALDTNSNL